MRKNQPHTEIIHERRRTNRKDTRKDQKRSELGSDRILIKPGTCFKISNLLLSSRLYKRDVIGNQTVIRKLGLCLLELVQVCIQHFDILLGTLGTRGAQALFVLEKDLVVDGQFAGIDVGTIRKECELDG